MARKKIVFVIVEGPSDQEALALQLSRLFDPQAVHVHIMHRDITSDLGITPANVISKVSHEIQQFAESLHIKSAHFQEIIHLVDMDGAYIPNRAVVFDESAHHPRYSPTEIRTANKDGIEQRNLRKSANLDRLCSVRLVWNVPYQMYYMSCNLDHVLYNKLNSSDKEKENDAHAFARKYKDNTPGFLEFISESDFSVTEGYLESWEYIRQDLHSLERHTNLGLCFHESSTVF